MQGNTNEQSKWNNHKPWKFFNRNSYIYIKKQNQKQKRNVKWIFIIEQKLETNLANAINEVAKEEPRRTNNKLLPFRPVGEGNPKEGPSLILVFHHLESKNQSKPNRANTEKNHTKTKKNGVRVACPFKI